MFGLYFNDIPRLFRTHYRCFSVSMLPGNERNDLEHGGKIIMPPSALDQLTRLNIVYPMLFKLSNSGSSRTTHCGVLEFVADEGKIYIPYWMMQNLMIDEGGILLVESTSLPVATFAKFQPHSTDFLDLTNPKAVLESRLRHFACLSTGDVIAIMYNNKVYELSVLETKPAEAVSVIECDLNVDFAPPVGYQEPQSMASYPESNREEDSMMDASDQMPESSAFVPFSGSGNRLDGKKKRIASETEEPLKARNEQVRGIPDYDYQVGQLTFNRSFRTKPAEEKNGEDACNGFIPFKGQGQSLRSSMSKK